MRTFVWMAVLGLGSGLPASTARAFSQYGAGAGGYAASPIGHEYLTIESAKDATGAYRELGPTDVAAVLRRNPGLDAKLRRLGLFDRFATPVCKATETRQARGYSYEACVRHEKELTLQRELRAARALDVGSGLRARPSLAAWSAAVGQRWVDTMGYSIAGYKALAKVTFGHLGWKCFDTVPQEPDDVQPDHFLRQLKHYLPEDRHAAYQEAVGRLKKYFFAAVKAPDDLIPMVDASFTADSFLVMRPAFLLGRALHLLQDSFSEEHAKRRKTVRNLDTIVEIKDYKGLPGIPQHTHKLPITPLRWRYRDHGDLIWTSKFSRVKRSNLKPTAVAAIEASKDLWIAFMQARKGQKTAVAAIDSVIRTWLRPPPKPSVPLKSPADRAQLEKARQGARYPRIVEQRERLVRKEYRTIWPDRRGCLENTGRLTTFAHDPLDARKPPFFWVWKKPLWGEWVAREFGIRP